MFTSTIEYKEHKMFARIRKNSRTQRRSVVICHSIRIKHIVRQLIIAVVGHSSDEDQLEIWLVKARAWIKAHGKQWLNQQLEEQRKITMYQHVSLFNMREEARVNVGIEDIFGKLYDELRFCDLLSKSHQETLRKIIFARLLEPSSKRRAVQISEQHFNEELPLDRVYRMLDALMKVSEQVQELIFSETEKLLGGKISIMLFDVTTLSFESIDEDELRNFGYSKDFKFNTTQVTLALATTQEGLPVGFKLFPGNTAESTTLIEAVTLWRKTLKIVEVTVIGDRAMMSEANLLALESAGFNYIIAFPLRKLPKETRQTVLAPSSYQTIAGDAEINRFKVLEYKARQLYVSHSQKRADKDRKDRERCINRLKKKLATCKNVKRLINNKSYLKYSEISGQATATLDEEKIARDAQWDGLHGVLSNQKLKGIEAYNYYRRLWVIEESFRINKHNLKMRPIYHFTPERVQAHILLCYMVFTLVRHIQFRLQKAQESMSVNRIIDAVRNVQASVMRDITNQKRYRMLSRLSEDAKIIYKILGIDQGLAITPYS